MVQFVNDKVQVHVVREFSINRYHKPMLEQLLTQGYVELRRPLFADEDGRIPDDAWRAFHDFTEVEIMEVDTDGWYPLGNLTDRITAERILAVIDTHHNKWYTN